MRCRVGDLAAIVRASCEQEKRDIGKVVLIVEPGYTYPKDFCHRWHVRVESGSLMVIDTDGIWSFETEADVPDENLRPLRDGEGEDEMLRIAGRPQETVREALESIRRELSHES
jgi:hypothetical protein